MSSHVDPSRIDGAEGPARRAMLEHAAACSSCREAWLAADPAEIFALLALAPVPPPVLDDVSREVAHRAGRDHGGIAAGSPPALARRAVSAAVVLLALASGVATVVLRPEAPPTVAARADVDVHPAASVSGVVDFTVGETQVVMVYNGDLKL